MLDESGVNHDESVANEATVIALSAVFSNMFPYCYVIVTYSS
jgi:hypothetical protein